MVEHHFFLVLGVNVGTLRLGGCLSFPIAFRRAYISVDFDVVGIGVGTGAVGAGGWFCRRVVIRSIFFFHFHELFLMLLSVLLVLLIVVMHLFSMDSMK